MKLTKKEAERLIEDHITETPVADALERIMDHEWSFDPRGDKLTQVLRQYHEQDYVLYATWSEFTKVTTNPPRGALCHLCAAWITRAPYFTTRDQLDLYAWEICPECETAMHRRVDCPSFRWSIRCRDAKVYRPTRRNF